MMFCPKCSSLLTPKKEGKKVVLACSCGYSNKKSDEGLKINQKIVDKEKIEIVSDEPESLPLIDAECRECGHNKAYFWVVQTRASDEPETKFFRCEKCRHTWRDYD